MAVAGVFIDYIAINIVAYIKLHVGLITMSMPASPHNFAKVAKLVMHPRLQRRF